MKHFYERYDDYSSFLRDAFKESSSKQKSSRSRTETAWHGGTWEEACLLAERGWLEGMSKIDRYRLEILPTVAKNVLRPIPINNVHGFSVDVGAFLSNMPECFNDREYEKRNYPGRLFTLVVSCSYSFKVSTDIVIQRGAIVCSLIDALEIAGNRVEVICNETSESGGYRNETDIVIKKHDQPLDMPRLAFCLAHPAMLRRILFSLNELSGWADFAQGYGYPAEASNKGDLYIDEINSGKVSNEEAISWLTEKLKEFGVEMESQRQTFQ